MRPLNDRIVYKDQLNKTTAYGHCIGSRNTRALEDLGQFLYSGVSLCFSLSAFPITDLILQCSAKLSVQVRDINNSAKPKHLPSVATSEMP